METKLQALTRIVKERPNERLTSLAHILNTDFLKQCFEELKRNRAPGVDGVTWEEYGKDLDKNIEELVSKMKALRYIPQPVKRVYIPKDDGSKRGLGIPSIEDKVVQMGIKKILETIYEPVFLDSPYGFRPGLSAHDAVEKVWHTIMLHPVSWVADIDIEKFFDTIDHKRMMELLQKRINDPNFLRWIGRFLKAGIMEEGVLAESDKGTPQGGVLSPVLANIYLHYTLDEWFQNDVKKQSKGYAELTRYADDFVTCFEHEADAQAFKTKLEKRLEENGLKVSAKKSKVIEFGRFPWMRWKRGGKKPGTFDFLGFTHSCGTGKAGKFKVEQRTSSKRLKKKVKMTGIWLKNIRNLVKRSEWWEVLKRKLVGHYQYYGISGNFKAINKFYFYVKRLAMKWSNRRSQKKSFNWMSFNRFLRKNPLPTPKICHKAAIRGCNAEEPYVVTPQVRFREGGPVLTRTGVGL